MKTIAKVESIAEFLARGGKITKVQPKVTRKMVARKEAVAKADFESADMSALPEALKIRFGIKA